MLEKIKKSSENFVIQFILFIIGCSFIFFGFFDQFSASDNTAIVVGNKKVSINELDEELRRQISQMQELMGNKNFNYKQALQMGLVDQIIDNMVYRILLDIEAKDKGILVSDDKIYEIIQNTKEFQDNNGNFSPEQFAYILNTNNISENKFVRETANNIARQILINAISSNIDNSNVAEILYKNKNEKRNFDVVSLKIENESIHQTPSDKELKEIYDININKFQQPEFRKISYITITPDMARKFKNIKKDDDKTYKTMIEMGENIIDEINGGANIDEIVKSFEVSKTMIPDLNVEGKKRDGSIFKDKIFTQKYRDIAFFALDEKGISDILDNGENLMLIYVDTVYPPKPKSFENVKTELKNIWKKNAQITQASKKINDIFNNLKNGDTFNSSVKKVDSKINLILNTQTGRFNNLYTGDFLTKLFNSEKNVPFISKSDNIYYIAIVKDIIIPEISNKADFEKFKEQEKQNFANMIVDDYINYLYKKHDVKKNEKVIQRLFN